MKLTKTKEILEQYFITLATLSQEYLIVRHRVACHSNLLPLLLQIVCNETRSLTLTSTSSRCTYCLSQYRW